MLSVLAAARAQRRALLPIGELDKTEVRRLARERGIRVADKPDSQDVCFITSRSGGAGRRGFLAERMTLHPGAVVEQSSGEQIGTTEAIELVTVGQRRGLGLASGAGRRFALEVDVAERSVVVGDEDGPRSSTAVAPRRADLDRWRAGRPEPTSSSRPRRTVRRVPR